MSEVLVHKAVEPDNLSVAGKRRLSELFRSLAEGNKRAWVQPKFDGVYAQFLFLNGGWRAFSRTGEPLPSVSEAVYRGFDANALIDRRYMGELWLPHRAHQEINGLARKKSEQHLELRLFDSVQLDHLNPLGKETYEERYDYLFKATYIEPVPNLPTVMAGWSDENPVIGPKEWLYDLARNVRNRASAYDGLILRDSLGLFEPGAGKNGEVVKIKPRAAGDFRVVGTTRGIGNRAGGVGALVVDLGAGVTCEVGTGLTQDDVHGPDPVGRIAEIEYLALTKDGKLREPAFKAWRFDKKEADVIHFAGD